jgi:hypothetical protein
VHTGDATHFGTVGAAINGALSLDAVPNHATATMVAFGRKGMDRTFETIEDVGLALHRHLESLVIVISTDFAPFHKTSP